MSTAFAKTARGAVPAGFFTAEANGLRWLAGAPGGPPLPEVLGYDEELLALSWIEDGAPTADAADRLGRELEALHAAGADGYGARWPGYIGPLPLDNRPTAGPWGPWFAQRRLLPYLKISADSGALDTTDVAVSGDCSRVACSVG